jgi:hypothetical protein
LRAENISRQILTIRDCRVMLDSDLAALYDEDFMFQLTEEEFAALRSQFVT